MSNIIGWIKGNLLIVISIVLIVLLLPAGWFFSNGWNKSVQEKATDAYNNEQRGLKSKSTINYSLPAVLEGEETISESRAPNRAVTEFYAQQKAEREKQVNDVVERGVALNMRDHGELVPGLLPKAEDERALRRLGLEMAEQIAGTRDEPHQSVYARLLRRLNADAPTDAETLSVTLQEFKEREEQQLAASNADGKLTTSQQSQLQQSLITRRLGEYKGRAEALTFYCTTGAIYSQNTSPVGSGFSNVFNEAPPPSSITNAMVFNWLWDYWVISDVLEAIASANTNAASGAMSIPEAPVKSVEQIRVSEMPKPVDLNATQDSGRGGFNTGTSDTNTSAATYTGHTGGIAGSSYDIRNVELTLVASSQDLPRLFDALGKTNYMTVTDVDLYEVDVWGDLEMGYYYGADHVVRAVIQVETVWLRSWTTQYMPDSVRTALGVPLEQVNLEDADG